jgi:hypothetical protein
VIERYAVTRCAGMVWARTNLCAHPRLTCMRLGKGTPPELQDAIAHAAATFAASANGRNRKSGGAKFSPEFGWGSWCAPGIGGLLCARRPISVAFHIADDCDSGAGCGRAADSRGVAAPGAGDFSGGRISRCARVLPRWWGTGVAALAYGTESIPRVQKSWVPATGTSLQPRSWLRSIAPLSFWLVLQRPVFISEEGESSFHRV